MREMCGTVEVLTAETIWAPHFMMEACSALEPTMKPVTLWRNIIGVCLDGELVYGGWWARLGWETDCWLHILMN
jgi:hypothetical protein